MSDAAIISILLVTAIVHASWNAALKAGSDRVLDMAAMRSFGLVFALVVIPFAPLPAPAAWPPLIASAIAHMVYFGCLISSYQRGDLSQVYPIARGSAPLLVALSAYLALGETPTPLGLIGVVVISLGIIIAGTGAFRQNLHAIGFALLTGLSIASYSLLGGIGVREAGTIIGYAAWLELLTCAPFIAFAVYRRRTHVVAYLPSPAAQRGFVLGIGSTVSYAIVLWAMTLLPLATVTATRETSAIFAALAGTLLMKEPFAGRRIVAAACVTGGIGLLVFG
ncbi:EamA family transporter [Pyruvatibacter mobilis]|uniref:EamA family transporter n=1 Tax=Pyruvatibacter mobilis TaxID=1712261 RepID=A0A845QEZ8_9HYPH|nr:DMT family transporter [Pyruvatibacter mobilis]NBG97112.1 EamA family transporter [Pyruvatibacter mobilis]QJD74372.1 EamA family transporter [Pyruvatibacter mobilis]GGD06401.1 hypothetical protein GCM10011587_07910 [Pyruvatibacter mobilis]